MLKKATEWGFVCNEDNQGNKQILPQNPTDRWKLQQIGEKWLLLIGNVPQVNLHLPEAIAFLERRRDSAVSAIHPQVAC